MTHHIVMNHSNNYTYQTYTNTDDFPHTNQQIIEQLNVHELQIIFNHLHAELFSRNIKIHLYYLLFLNAEIAQVV